MTQAADLVLTNAEVHTLADPDPAETAEAVAVTDGEIVRVDRAYEIDFLVGVDTTVIDLDGRVLLPGFVDAHTHLPFLGQHLVNADLRGASGPEECIERLAASTAEGEWSLGFGFDESGWNDPRPLDRSDLDRVSTDRPVAAFREDMHVAALNGVALDRLRDEMADADVRTDDGQPTGIVIEGAVDVLYRAIEPDKAATRELLLAAQEAAHRRGVTTVHEMVRQSHAPRIYRDLELADELTLRVRLNYWRDHLDAVVETGLRTNHGGERVTTGGIKSYTDGTFGGRTAKLSEPYADGKDDQDGRWVVEPAEFATLVRAADDAGLQVAAHAIGDAAVEAVTDTYAAEATDPAGARHRIEHAELCSDAAIDRMAELGIVASVQPNFLKWAEAGGLYDQRLGPERRQRTNRYRDFLDAGLPLAFGSDCMPLDPLLGVHYAVTHPVSNQRLTVTEALRAYTRGAAYAGFDEDRLGTIAPGMAGDFVALSGSPWESPDAINELDVALTIVAGEVVFDGR